MIVWSWWGFAIAIWGALCIGFVAGAWWRSVFVMSADSGLEVEEEVGGDLPGTVRRRGGA